MVHFIFIIQHSIFRIKEPDRYSIWILKTCLLLYHSRNSGILKHCVIEDDYNTSFFQRRFKLGSTEWKTMMPKCAQAEGFRDSAFGWHIGYHMPILHGSEVASILLFRGHAIVIWKLRPDKYRSYDNMLNFGNCFITLRSYISSLENLTLKIFSNETLCGTVVVP